jgi:tetratricopeptide (TPR) repeat protein
MQATARICASSESPLAHRVVYVMAPDELSSEKLLFAQEIGARFVCFGPGKNDELKEYLKRVCTELHKVGSLYAIEEELEVAIGVRNFATVKNISDKLRGLSLDSEEVLRLLCTASLFINDAKRLEVYLKRLLGINSQHLWAANTLGKLYLRTGKAAQGMEVLQRLSQFHELNSERMLVLGDAQVVAGRVDQAQATLEKTAALVGNDDIRVKEGMAKVKLAQKDLPGALTYLGAKEFSREMVSFLNMRAIMSIRLQKFDEGIEFYSYALHGSGPDNQLKAKLLFNMGLGFVRTGNLERATACLSESCTLGGPKFQRASGPLKKVALVMKNREKNQAVGANDVILSDAEGETEWETLA